MNEAVDTDDAVGPRAESNSLAKMLGIMDLFSPERPVLSTNDILSMLGASRSTGYRYIKALGAAGFLTTLGNGYYVLGARIIELDLQIRSSDPLLAAGRSVLDQLVDATGHPAVLCMLYRDSVLCIHAQAAPLSSRTLFSRGQRRSLFRGASSKTILAQLPNHRLRSIHARNQAEIAELGLGADWGDFRRNLTKIRKDGHAMTHGEINPGILGVAAPIYGGENIVLGSVGIALAEEELGDIDLNRQIVAVKRAARQITLRTAGALRGDATVPIDG